jgi:hypothetical protein
MNLGMFMSKLKILFILSLTLGLVSCTEEISDKIKQSDQPAVGNNSQLAIGKKMKLVHKMGDNQSYHLHSIKGNNYPCEIEAKGNNFLASTYGKSDPNDNIDCILEVDELDLYFDDLKYELQVDDLLCEYVHYVPFKFFQYPAGASTQRVYNLECDSSCEDTSICDARKGYYFSYNFSGAYTGFDQKMDEAPTCHFDHSSNEGPNCDTGSMTMLNYKIYGVPTSSCTGFPGRTNETECTAVGEWSIPGDPTGTCDVYPAARTTEANCTTAGTWDTVNICTVGTHTIGSAGSETTQCGGSSHACLAGPGVDQVGADKHGIIYDNRELKKFTKEWSVDSPFGKGYYTNRYVANFSRVCSNNAQKTPTYYQTALLLNSFKADEIETHAPVRPYGNSGPQYSAEPVDFNHDGLVDYYVYADHSFVGRTHSSVVSRNIVKPYYAFYCLDKARDVKAQIRLFVREWDKELNKTSSNMTLISDLSAASPLIDSYGFQDYDHPWNNFHDWDDFFDNQYKGYKTFKKGLCAYPDPLDGTAVADDYLEYGTNPGVCLTHSAAQVSRATCEALDPVTTKRVWVTYLSKCYTDQSAGLLSRAACYDTTVPGDRYWKSSAASFSGSGSGIFMDHIRNFPWDGI